MGESNLKTTQGVVTSFSSDYGWINESICFNCNAVISRMPPKHGLKVVQEEDETSHELHQTAMRQVDGLCDDIDDSGPSDLETRVITARVTSVSRDAVYIDEETYFSLDIASEGFTPYKGDWIDVEYCVLSGTSNIKALSMKPLFYRHLEEVCITSMHGRNGVLDGIIFFTLDSLKLPDGYSPQINDIVSVDIVESTHSWYIWRAISMTPVPNSL
ncbi:cancer/testis antigen 55-like [Tupaia chinensis]|uniref:cancer/testis antigen 55-like n=1 Tax=Tupaia chinensis TaxID=246437 RepID=UPI0003C8D7E7|nr:cancer/testis antigen 55-like [Tupaia chinensis]